MIHWIAHLFEQIDFQTYTYKIQFNKRVLELIERKRTITEQINKDLKRLQSLGQSLGVNQDLFDIPLLPSVEDGNEKYETMLIPWL